MLGWDTEVASISVGVHAISSSQQSIKSGLVLIHLLSRGVELRLRLAESRLLLQGLLLRLVVEGIKALLFRKRSERRDRIRLSRLRTVVLSKGVVGTSRCGLQCLLVLVSCPGVVATRLDGWLRRSWRRQRLLGLLLKILVVAGRLRLERLHILLLLLAKGIHTHSSLPSIPRGIIRLEASWLRLLEAGVCIGHVARLLVLHLVLFNGVCEEINRVSLLISLVETSKLRLRSLRCLRCLHRVVVKQRCGIAVLKFLASPFIFLLAELDCSLQVVIVLAPVLSAFSLLPILFLLEFAGLEGQSVFGFLFLGKVPPVAGVPSRWWRMLVLV